MIYNKLWTLSVYNLIYYLHKHTTKFNHRVNCLKISYKLSNFLLGFLEYTFFWTILVLTKYINTEKYCNATPYMLENKIKSEMVIVSYMVYKSCFLFMLSKFIF